jgi:ferredoxin-thioredoxin reductase catalytic subunit
MIEIKRLHGCILNPNDKVVNAILRRIDKCNGYCPCVAERSEETKCPCVNYRNTGECHCQLYINPNKDKVGMYDFSGQQ